MHRNRVAPALVVALVVVAGIVTGMGGWLQTAAQEGTPAASPCAAGSETEAAALGASFLEAFVAGDAERLGAILAPDYVHHWGLGPDTDGEEEMIDRALAYVAAFDGLTLVIDQVIAADDLVVVRWTQTGTQSQPLGDIGPTTVEDTWTGINIGRVACGQIVEGWSEVDHFGRLVRIGVLEPDELADAATPTP